MGLTASRAIDLRSTFEGLVHGLVKPLYNAAVRLAGNTEDGIDLTRDTITRAYSIFVSDQRTGPVRPWLYQVLVDVYTEYRLNSTVSPPSREIVESFPDWSESTETTRSALGFFPRTEETPVDTALRLLPDELRVTYLLCDVERFSYSQISRIIRRSRMTVAGRVFQARWLLRAALRKQPPRRPPIER